ncbi:MAG: DEAD/DEAH box helicase [Euryarchaeota archaeon]|nr:DEAD/DEAH box helicase [Euryarchaeota archaeon]
MGPQAGAFASLSSTIRDLLREVGMEAPTPPQEAAIPRILAGRDVLIISPTGSGKTEAALLPVFDRLAVRERLGIGCVYITPLRALNRDMERRITWWAQKLGIRVEIRHGDTPPSARRKQAVKPPDLLVTTPETLQAILPAKRMRSHLKWVRHVIVDEVHQLAKDRRGIQLAIGLERLREVAGDFQRIGLSATVGNPEEVAALFGGESPLEVVQVAPPKKAEYGVEWPKPNDEDFELARQLFISPEVAASLTLMQDAIEEHRATLVFVNSRNNAELLSSRFNMLTDVVGVHHGSLPREAREKAECEFKAGALKALVCTSTLELGIDVGSVDHALQYMSPRQATSLVQRVGRAGHTLTRVSKGTIVAVSADDATESLAVIRRARRGDLEPLKIHKGALDVLGHQIVGLVFDAGGRAERKRILAVVRRAWPYRDDRAFERVADYMVHLTLLRAAGSALILTAKGRDYYFRNLSTIRDERTYPVIDLTTMKPVGILGEEEIVLRARRGVSFIVRGRTWKIVEIAPDGRVFVNPVEDPTARIPGWDGEILPVPYEVARETARLRGEIAAKLQKAPASKAIDELAAEWPANKSAVRRIVEVVAHHLETGAPVPTDRTLLLEAFDRFLIVHAPFGEVVNNTFGDLIEELLARRNLVRFWWTDAYRILFELTRTTEEVDLRELAAYLFGIDDAELERSLDILVRDHLPIGFRMKFIAERFGAIPRGLLIPADELNSFEVRFRGTPVEEEAKREMFLEHVDFDRVRHIFRDIRGRTLRVETFRGKTPTPLGYPIVRRYVEAPELFSPEAEREQNVERMRQFLLTERVNLLCFACGHIDFDHEVEALPEKPACPACASNLLSPLSWHGGPIRDAFTRHQMGLDLSDEEEKELVRARQGADLVAVYGRKAVLALSVYGVGPQAASKVLAKMHRDEKTFFADLYDAKLRYVTTRPYWDQRPAREPTGKTYAY